MESEAHAFAERMASIMKGILESGREAIPLCFAKRKNGESMMIGFEFTEERPESKDMAAIAMRILASDPEVDYVVFLSDAWCAKIKTEEMEQAMAEGVRSLPQRKETIVVSLFGNHRLSEIGQWRYERIEGRAVFASPKLEWMVPDSAEGRFIPGHSGGSRQ